jgi:hypothetical protein
MFQLSNLQRAQIVVKRSKEHKNYKTIAREVGCTGQAASNVFRHFEATGEIQGPPKGPQSETVDVGLLNNLMQFNPKAKSAKLAAMYFDEKGESISPRTIRFWRVKLGYRLRISRPEYALSEGQLLRRKQWAQEHVRDNVNLWAFDDETSWVLGAGKEVLWLKPRDPLPPMAVQPQSKRVFLWGLLWDGHIVFQRKAGSFNSQSYIDCLKQHILPMKEQFRRYTLISDNAGYHTSNETTDWINKHHIKRLLLPAASPQLNAIEHVWAWIKDWVTGEEPTTKQELEAAIDSACHHFPRQLCLNYVRHVKKVMEGISEDD